MKPVNSSVIVLQLEERVLNDQLMLLERVFLLPKGLPGRPDVRHALFSPANFDAYGKKKMKYKFFKQILYCRVK